MWKSFSNFGYIVMEKVPVMNSFLGPFWYVATSKEEKGPEDIILVVWKLVYGLVNI